MVRTPINGEWIVDDDKPCRRCGCVHFKVNYDEALGTELECQHCQLIRTLPSEEVIEEDAD